MPKKKEPRFKELGVSGLRYGWEGVREEFLRDLQGSKGRKIFHQMEATDPTCGAILFAIAQVVSSADWYVDLDLYSDETRDAAQFVQENLRDMAHSWKSFISGVCSQFIYGWSYFEIVYKKRLGRDASPPSKYNDGKIGIRKLVERPQSTLYGWEFDKEGGIRGMNQTDPNTLKPVFIPIEKSLLFRTQTSRGNPEGRALLVRAYKPWYYLDKFEKIEGIGTERDLSGLPMMKVPVEVFTDSDKSDIFDRCQNLVTNVRRDEMEGLLIPHDSDNPNAYEFTLLSSPGQKQIDISQIIDRKKNEIASVVLADFISLGHETFGSFALGRSKRDIFEIAVMGWLDGIKSVLNSHLVPRLLELNSEFSNLKSYPVINYSIKKVPSLENISRIISSLARAKVDFSQSPDTIDRVLEETGLPPLTHEKLEVETTEEND